MYMIIAWRIMYLMRSKDPTLNEVIRNLAMLGGFLGRKSDKEPGAKSIWKGFQRIQDCVYGIQVARKLV